MSGRYVPKKANASIREVIPERFQELLKPPVAPTLPEAIPKEPIIPKEVKPKEDRPKEDKPKTVKRTIGEPKVVPAPTTATDRVPRSDRVGEAIQRLEGEITTLKAKGKSTKKKEEDLATYKTKGTTFDVDIHKPIKGEANPLGTYADKQKEAEENPGQYALDTRVYMPSTRTGFYKFIAETYGDIFKIGTIKEPDEKACEKLLQAGAKTVTAFLYQRFIKEYLRQSSPYRGLLVYHGLGSGKTCSAIAAAESLYGIANKKIIVMTPQSLRNNFIKEISFCGFRHFSLNNHWTRYNLMIVPTDLEVTLALKSTNVLVSRPLPLLYARSVLSLGSTYLDKLIERAQKSFNEGIIMVAEGKKTLAEIKERNNAYLWIPDFTKPPNFNELTPLEKDMVRFQIAETIKNRFEFISYNGISNQKLKAIACDPSRPFDNAIIVVDEIHNLVRLMQGDIEPYLFEREGKKRNIGSEPVLVGKWVPKLCDKSGAKQRYTRGYLFYRLLSGAKNSKIIGLSGTPIINVPEEIGILANVLGGYIDTVKITINVGNLELATIFETLANKDERVDYVRILTGTSTNSIVISMFNEGYIKVLDTDGKTFKGVVHSNEERAQIGIEGIYERLKKTFLADERVIQIIGRLGIVPTALFVKPEYKAYPRLPPDGDTFREEFVDLAGLGIRKENEIVLKKRLTGLVSYYRRARPEFFPSVGVDEIVKCEMSDHALKTYIEQRDEEITKEVKNKKGELDIKGELFSVVEKFSKGKTPSSYRFRSRAVCNYAFPGKLSESLIINRPYPSDNNMILAEVSAEKEEATEETPDTGIVEEVDELSEEEIELVRKSRGTPEGVIPGMSGLSEEEREIVRAFRINKKAKEEEEEATKAEKEDREIVEDVEVKEEIKLITLDYSEQIKLAMGQLNANRDTLFAYGDETNGLKKYSRKLYEIMSRMEVSKGPVLVYSQYKTVEGLGVLAIALRTNGYDEIKFKKTAPWQPVEFDEASVTSFKKGPAFTKRFIMFSGEEDQRQRAIILAVFNGQWSQLTRSILNMFTESGFDTGSEKSKYIHGEIIKCIGITGAGAEGISLRNVRQVHIMEPFWNMARLEQVKGRAIRVCSHADLPKAERVVDIYTYVSAFSEKQIEESKISKAIQRSDGNITSDQNVLMVAERKDEISQKLLQILKEVSVDCEMNFPDNYVDNEPLACFSVSDKGSNPFMFEPNLKQDIIQTKASMKFTGSKPSTAVSGSIGLIIMPYKGKRYIVGPWTKKANGLQFAYIYDIETITEAIKMTPISSWPKAGTVDYDPSREKNIGVPVLYDIEEEEEEEEEGEEEEGPLEGNLEE